MGEKKTQTIEIEEIKKVKLAPGDLLVLRHPGRLSKDAVNSIKYSLNEIIEGFDLKGKVRIALLEEGMDLQVISKLEEISN